MGKWNIKACVLGMVSTNCYIVYKENETDGAGVGAEGSGRETLSPAVIIDPADNAEYLLKQVKELGLKVEAILLTHGHFDHILAAEELREKLQVPIFAGEKEERLLGSTVLTGGSMIGVAVSLKADRWLKDGEELELLGETWKVLHTPGHTEGSVCYYVPEQQVLFSGDTLFCRSFGRIDLPTGNGRKLIHSITKILFQLPDETSVCPGHEDMTTIGVEKVKNPIRQYAR